VRKATSGITGQEYEIGVNGRTVRVPILELHDVVLVKCTPG
jgi:hypothetical protein